MKVPVLPKDVAALDRGWTSHPAWAAPYWREAARRIRLEHAGWRARGVDFVLGNIEVIDEDGRIAVLNHAGDGGEIWFRAWILAAYNKRFELIGPRVHASRSGQHGSVVLCDNELVWPTFRADKTV